jgi:paired amphipathic helix protein Sin3a
MNAEELTEPQVQDKRQINFYLTKKDDPTFDNSLSPTDQEHRWRYYIASYTSFAPTGGIPTDRLTRPVLPHNLRASGTNPNSTSYPPSPTSSDGAERVRSRFENTRGEENLVLRVAVETYHPLFQPNTQECFFDVTDTREGGNHAIKEIEELMQDRTEGAKERFELNNAAMKDVSREDVERANEAFGRMAQDGEAMEVGG